MSIPHQRITSPATARPNRRRKNQPERRRPPRKVVLEAEAAALRAAAIVAQARDRMRIGQRRRGPRPRLHIQDVELANWLSYDGRTDFDIQGQAYLRLTRPYLPGLSEEATRDPEVLTAFADAFAAVLTDARYPCQVTTSQGSPAVSRAPSTR